MNIQSFKIVIWIYNLSMDLVVTPTDGMLHRRFKVETITGEVNPMIIKYMPDHTWVAENVTMKFFTEKYIRELGALIESKKQEWCS
jgi:hypothetical protein